MARDTQVNIKQLSLQYIRSRGDVVHVEDVVYAISKKISVNQAVRIYRSYHRGKCHDDDDLTYMAHWAKRRQIRVVVRELARAGKIEEISDGEYQFKRSTRSPVDKQDTVTGEAP